MRRLQILIIIVFSINLVDAQQPFIINYSSTCESNVIFDNKLVKERINRVYRNDSLWTVELTVIKYCESKFRPEVKFKHDTLFIEFVTILRPVITVHSGKDLERSCAYDMKMDISIDTIKNLIIDRKHLPLTDERFEPYQKKYFIYKGDTTGFEDNLGIVNGYQVYESNKFVLKQFYKDNEPEKCELYDNTGKLIESSYDCLGIWNRIKNK